MTSNRTDRLRNGILPACIALVVYCAPLLGAEGTSEAEPVRAVHSSGRVFNKSVLVQTDSSGATWSGRKSPQKALLFSMLLPGTGQLYAQKGKESLIKGIAFLGIEAAAWVLYASFTKRGNDKRDQFERYANENWDINAYLRYLESYLPDDGVGPGDLGQVAQGEDPWSSPGVNRELVYQTETDWGDVTKVSVHHLFATGRQQYYEMIYKYPEQFALGWADVDPMSPPVPSSPTGYTYQTLTPLMLEYRGIRSRHNELLSHARAMTSVMLANRMLSLVDAAWTVHRRNRQEPSSVRLGFRLNSFVAGDRFVAMPTLQLTY